MSQSVLVQTAISLNPSLKQELESSLSAKFPGATFVYQVDPALISGLRLTVAGGVLDLTGKYRLDQIQGQISL